MQRAVQKVMKRDMSDAPLHIVFSLFDANQDGNLASAELVTVPALTPFVYNLSVLYPLKNPVGGGILQGFRSSTFELMCCLLHYIC